MKQLFYRLTCGLIACLFLQSCTRTSDDVWEDTKSAGRHFKRSLNAIAGCPGDSRQIRYRQDFEGIQDENWNCSPYTEADYSYPSLSECPQEKSSSMDYDFIPLEDPNNEVAILDYISRQPSETPGEAGSSIPGIEAFRDPSTIPELQGIFLKIFFDYNSSLIKKESISQLIKIAAYLRDHPTVYLFIEGHTDERGPQAYNLALGSRRANCVRDFLIDEGVHPDQLFTISYGKERPIILESHEGAWAKNRRAEFKVYAR